MRLSRSVLASGLVACALISADHSGRTIERKPLPFSPGETLTYNVTWSVFPAGRITASLSRVNGNIEGPYVITTTARSQGLASLLYKVQDEFRSVFNPETLCSIQISKQINEGGRHRSATITFDSQRRVAVLEERDLSGGNKPPKYDEHEIPPCVQDIVTAFYYVRSQPLRVGQTVKLAMNDGSKTTTVVVPVTTKKKLQTPVGEHEALRAEPAVFGNLYEKKKGKLIVWFSDDEFHYPLRIKAELKLGTITGTLVSISPAPPGYSTSASAAANEVQHTRLGLK
jgi:hypothetical protein